ncbi:MAG: endonuclease/exonuclease/phosphatase family protein [Pseudomonadota bacterium]
MQIGWRCALGFLAANAASSATPPPQRADALTIASWNLEWLLSPETAHISRLACNSGHAAPVPCDVARDLARDTADLARLAHYARQLDADVIAFQEVENRRAALRVLGGYDICINLGQGVQQAGFAVRIGIAHRCDPPLQSLAQGSRQRAGAVLVLYPGTKHQIELVAVHLKSGCSRDALDSAVAACRTLSAQGKALAAWMQQRAAANARVIVMGDFNRTGPNDEDIFWQQLQVGAVPGSAYVNASAGVTFSNCYRGQPFSQYIDHILVSHALAPQIVSGSFRHHGYRSLDAYRYRLSDHCPISISLIPASYTNKSGLSSVPVASRQRHR